MAAAASRCPEFSNILISDPDGRKAWFDGLYVQLDRPYGVGGTKYGYGVTYTLGKAEQTGGDLFSLDFPRWPTIRVIRPATTSGIVS